MPVLEWSCEMCRGFWEFPQGLTVNLKLSSYWIKQKSQISISSVWLFDWKSLWILLLEQVLVQKFIHTTDGLTSRTTLNDRDKIVYTMYMLHEGSSKLVSIWKYIFQDKFQQTLRFNTFEREVVQNKIFFFVDQLFECLIHSFMTLSSSENVHGALFYSLQYEIVCILFFFFSV